MEFSITTPAILFPAISLLLLAYTNRFMALASLIRSLKNQYIESNNPNLIGQISNLRKRIYLIRNMQACGIASFFLCVISMLLLFNDNHYLAKATFGFSLVLLLISLYLSLREIQISIEALKIELGDLENAAIPKGKKAG
ncbi:DUF2721 domain-containing protein [Paradesertivirga mongoliensis]|uniref:DUF2721 domain-containing protein n=1 Tax=Paradesertivirga mongoliensis TaxID=2100740 RepID=A0ABW4ZNR8_9SPHI|nr:DUF2721 domain-containing protein [Pedobacter mongoliensis]